MTRGSMNTLNGERRYRVWAGNPKGLPERKEFCIATVGDTGRSVLTHQCHKKRGHGPDGEYCKVHAKRFE